MGDAETFFGLVEDAGDALRVLQLCREGRLGRVRRRLHDRERAAIRSGSVFVFDEEESGIKRWTDGRLWSPSRILGAFLVYREIERLGPGAEDAAGRARVEDWFAALQAAQRPANRALGSSLLGPNAARLLRSKKLQGTTAAARAGPPARFAFRPGGLFKKTFSARVDGRMQHLVAYYSEADFVWTHRASLPGAPGAEAGPAPPAAGLMDALRAVPVPQDLASLYGARRAADALGRSSPPGALAAHALWRCDTPQGAHWTPPSTTHSPHSEQSGLDACALLQSAGLDAARDAIGGAIDSMLAKQLPHMEGASAQRSSGAMLRRETPDSDSDTRVDPDSAPNRGSPRLDIDPRVRSDSAHRELTNLEGGPLMSLAGLAPRRDAPKIGDNAAMPSAGPALGHGKDRTPRGDMPSIGGYTTNIVDNPPEHATPLAPMGFEAAETPVKRARLETSAPRAHSPALRMGPNVASMRPVVAHLDTARPIRPAAHATQTQRPPGGHRRQHTAAPEPRPDAPPKPGDAVKSSAGAEVLLSAETSAARLLARAELLGAGTHRDAPHVPQTGQRTGAAAPVLVCAQDTRRAPETEDADAEARPRSPLSLLLGSAARQ